ncbi:hypothetical protein AAZX31_07G075600 [Glycine max]|nr:Two-component response regulator ARR2 [Glycine max]
MLNFLSYSHSTIFPPDTFVVLYTLSQMDSDNFQSVDLRKYICPVPGIQVLVVDNNLTCLATVLKILQTLGYEVVTASLASEALAIIEKKKDELNLALLEVDLPDMKINSLTEKIREISDLQYFLMTANDNPLCNGSKRYFKKPVTIYDLSSLWMYLKWKIEDGSIVTEDVRSYVNNNQEFQPFMNARGQTLQIGKRKEQRHKIGGNQSESLLLKRKRLSWTGDSHTKFLGGVEFSGTSGEAPPNQRHQLRNVPGLAKQNVKNHLQQSLQQANPIHQHSNIHSSDLNLGSQHVSQTGNYNGKRHQLPNCHVKICNCMHLHSQRNPLYELSILSPSDQISTGQNQLYPPGELFGAAHYTSGSGEFMNNGNGKSGETCAENTTDIKVFSEDTHVYCVDDLAVQSEMDFSTLLANDMCQRFHPFLPVPLPPSDGKEHGISGAEAGQIDEIFYPPNGTQQFSDEDLNIWLSMVKSLNCSMVLLEAVEG